MGQSDERIVDQQANEFSRAVFCQMEIDGEVICCEGPKDNAPVFFRREKVGNGYGPKLEFIIDPFDGTTATIKGDRDVISSSVCAPKGCLQV